ncbi:hypothetical protein [Streptomyces sp. NRRL F-5650]|uniref:hypothetical protein n=1 Tax=Streptomyces sp. NRRL F-5650 TaxID=1463868 RepID=UPI0004CA8EE7|nr:hypothetical protein [Streptomyces sp. NRRL F-5650]
MRDRQTVEVLAKACAAVGAVLAAYGTLVDRTALFRVGLLILLISIAVSLHRTCRTSVRQVITHQARVSGLTQQERQQWTELGWNAARIDAMTDHAEGAQGAEIVALPTPPDAPPMRRNGSA